MPGSSSSAIVVKKNRVALLLSNPTVVALSTISPPCRTSNSIDRHKPLCCCIYLSRRTERLGIWILGEKRTRQRGKESSAPTHLRAIQIRGQTAQYETRPYPCSMSSVPSKQNTRRLDCTCPCSLVASYIIYSSHNKEKFQIYKQ